MRRDCQSVILQIKDKIPESKVELLKDLQWNFEDAAYKAPEETLQWERTAMTLQKHIPKPIENWEFEVISIFTVAPIEELRKIFR